MSAVTEMSASAVTEIPKSSIVKLSILKFLDLMNTNKFYVISGYQSDSRIIFFHCKTPTRQIPFFVYFPSQYQMKIVQSNDLNIKNIVLHPSIEDPTSKTVSYIKSLLDNPCMTYLKSYSERTTQLDKISTSILSPPPKFSSDIVILANQNITLRRNKKIESYNCVSPIVSQKDLEVKVGKIETDVISNIESTVNELIQKSKTTYPDTEDKNMKTFNVKEEEIEEVVNVEFEDDTNTIINTNLLNILNDDGNNENIKNIKMKKHLEPPPLEKDIVSMGMLNICIDINNLFKMISNEDDIETILTDIYLELDLIDIDKRDKRTDELEIISKKLVEKSRTAMQKLKDKELQFKSEITRIKKIIEKIENLKDNKSMKNLSTYRLKLNSMIDDINLSILRTKDDAEYILHNYNMFLAQINKLL